MLAAKHLATVLAVLSQHQHVGLALRYGIVAALGVLYFLFQILQGLFFVVDRLVLIVLLLGWLVLAGWSLSICLLGSFLFELFLISVDVNNLLVGAHFKEQSQFLGEGLDHVSLVSVESTVAESIVHCLQEFSQLLALLRNKQFHFFLLLLL